ncbi:hypothetical protein WN73_12475 [Bradyrhizobium sp. CCBAU 45394]|nr:hypothetical protein [Bradyrhizobium sp. CCBAU 45394]
MTQSAVAQQQGTTITLSCNGTSKFTATSAADLKPDPVTNLGIIVNAGNRTVSFLDNVIPITTITATLVAFSSQYAKRKPTISGGIDRVTGSADLDWWYENVGNNTHWDLTCRPATRLF